MDFKTILSLIMAGVLAGNYAIQNFLGIDTVLGGCKNTATKSLGMGLAVTVVMLVSAVLCHLVQTFVLAGALQSLQLLVFTLLVLAVSAVLQCASKAVCKKGIGCYAVIALNSAVLGLCLNTAALTLGEAIFTALGVGLGYMVILVVYGELRQRVNDAAAPKAFRGLPLSLLTAGVISLALLAF